MVRRWVVVGGGLLAVLGACSDDKSRRRNSELVVDQPAAPPSEPSATAPENPESASAIAPTGPLAGVGRRYRVAVGTAYFFDNPQQSTPNGKYLRRGDVFYGEGEWNGFVKTGFVGPAGDRSTGWLKRQELSTAAERPATAPAPAATGPEPPASNAAPRAGSFPPPAAASGARRAVVQTDRAYFHNTPDLATPRKAHCVRGDNVRLGEERGAAVYVAFTNWENVTTTGWMRKDALASVR
ncbi:hypothetical protein BEN47_09330 [Hymenobacter lapidarius]|uniref:Uncharacterized protein n=1 Tax=Hymenobacter lapidarius TaxID=1908237 RepID=A0A1G1TBL8_9BACT|nr:hypothetical protein BEN47_09330 [Hymenobacter lapidarius]